jgi:glycine dehydrogenase subunit 1
MEFVSYLFTTPDQQRDMLETIGVSSVEDLFAQVPDELRFRGELALPEGKTELELESEIRAIAGRNRNGSDLTCFLGGGVYDHFIPSAVDEIATRGEFYTAYTPYQAEASQGSLQVFFEYQTLICELLGMAVSNASLYEGGTALQEAALMAMRVTRRSGKVVVLGSVHPEYREILETYLAQLACEIVEIPTPDGVADVNRVSEAIDDQTACLIVQSPNFFGCVEPMAELADAAHRGGALLVSSTDPISLGLLKRPGELGVDIATAEGQPLGIPMQYGGPFLGILACREDYMRKMPGRVIGTTTDRRGGACFVLNLQAREQHIRRDKATSNICTNQGLLALRATVYLTLLGPQGLRESAERCCRLAHYAANRLAALPHFEAAFSQPFFKEFALRYAGDPNELTQRAARAGFALGPTLDRFPNQFDASQQSLLLCAVTEKRTVEEIDQLVEALSS